MEKNLNLIHELTVNSKYGDAKPTDQPYGLEDDIVNEMKDGKLIMVNNKDEGTQLMFDNTNSDDHSPESVDKVHNNARLSAQARKQLISNSKNFNI